MTVITWKVYAYLEDAWQDITSSIYAVNGVTADWGMSSNYYTDRLAKTGTLNFSLVNSGKDFLPSGSSVISADWKKGTLIKVEFTHLGIAYEKFYATVDKINFDAGILVESKKAHVTALDWMDYAVNLPINGFAIQENKRADEGITSIVEAMPIQPLATEFDEGEHIFSIIFSDTLQKTKGYSEIQKLVDSEFGFFYNKADNTLVFESKSRRTGLIPYKQIRVPVSGTNYLLKADGGKLLKADGGGILLASYNDQDVFINNEFTSADITYGDSLVNRVGFTANPLTINEEAVLVYSLGSPLFIDANTEQTIDIQFRENASQRLVAILEPEYSKPTALLHFEEMEGDNNLVDEGGHQWVANDVEIVNNIRKIGNGSLYFDGSGSYASSISSNDYEFGNGDFTVEWWEYRFDATTNGCAVARSGTSGFVPFRFGVSDGTNSKVYISSNGSSFDIANGRTFGAISTNTWVHYAICRSGNTFYMWKDGALTDSWTSSSSILASSADFVLGRNNATYINACIDEFNLIKGYAKYTSAFTPSTEPLSLTGILFSAWSNSNQTGTELKQYFSISPTYGASSASVVISNSGSVGGWFRLKVYGYIVESASQISDFRENQESIDNYGYHELNINQVYQQDLESGRIEAEKILDAEKEPKVVVNSVTMNANRNDVMALSFLNTDIGDLVRLKEDQNEVDAAFFIQGYSYRAVPIAEGVSVDFTWRVKKFENALTPVAVEFFGDDTLSYIDFGNLQSVLGDDVPYRIYSFWVYQTTDEGSPVSGVFSTNGKQDIYLFNNRVRISQSFSGTDGEWRGSTTTFSDDTWVHILIAYDNSSPSNDPVIYVNNNLQTVTELSTPTGTYDSLENSQLRMGYLQVNGSTPMKGKIKDFRVYDGSLVLGTIADFADDLYDEGGNGTGYTNGLLFHPFYVKTSQVASYIDEELTENTPVSEAVNLIAGKPITVAGDNPPIVRSI